MRIPRIYHDGDLTVGQTIELSRNASQHVCKVLRLTNNAELRLFNGRGNSVDAKLTNSSAKAARAEIIREISEQTESPLKIELGLGMSKGDRMDYAIQKAVEVGVYSITPLLTERTVVRLDDKRKEKKLNHWQGIILSACEQCGRSCLPKLNPVVTLEKWLAHDSPCKIVFDTESEQGLSQLTRTDKVSVLIGPEGGLSETEIAYARTHGFHSIKLGPRTLRTETAVVSACSALQSLWGDYA